MRDFHEHFIGHVRAGVRFGYGACLLMKRRFIRKKIAEGDIGINADHVFP